MDTILAIDLGTSSTRARLYRSDDAALVAGATAALHHEPVVTADGGAVLDPEALVREVVACCADALAQAPPGVRVHGVGVSCFWHSFVALDAEAVPLTPVLLWSDRRSKAFVATLRAAHPEQPQVTGCPWHTSYLPARLAWLEATDPEAFHAAERFLSPAEFVFARLFGPERVTCSFSMASGSGLLDQGHGVWLSPWASRCAAIADTPVRGLLPPYAALLPALAEIPWFPAIGDGAGSNVGCGALGPGKIALMIGTSGAMRVAVPGATPPALPDGLWRYQIARDRFLLGGALSNAGNLWEWLTETVRLPEGHQAAIGALAPDAHGLTVLPFLAGERAPLWRDDLTAAVVGLSAATTPVSLARAHLEAVAYRFAAIRDRLRAVAPSAQLIGTGAGLKASPVWTQILADVLGEEIAVSAEQEASARGAALWVRQGLGLGTIDDAPVPAIVGYATPHLAHAETYAAARVRHEALLNTLLG
jgi:gluconokinase